MATDTADSGFGIGDFLVRLLMALALVLLTYNPTEVCFVQWLRDAVAEGTAGALHALAGVVLLIGWVVFLNTARDSLGTVGIVLGALLCAALVWVLVDFDLVQVGSGTTVVWIVLICVALLLAVGMAWGHWKRQASGQVDVDEGPG